MLPGLPSIIEPVGSTCRLRAVAGPCTVAGAARGLSSTLLTITILHLTGALAAARRQRRVVGRYSAPGQRARRLHGGLTACYRLPLVAPRCAPGLPCRSSMHEILRTLLIKMEVPLLQLATGLIRVLGLGHCHVPALSVRATCSRLAPTQLLPREQAESRDVVQ